MAVSVIVPRAITVFGEKIVWFSGQVALATCLCVTPFVHNIAGAICVIAAFGVPWSVSMTVPFAMTANIAPIQDRGLFMGLDLFTPTSVSL